MTVLTMTPGRARHPEACRPILPNAVLGTLVFVISELMFFMSLVSTYLVARAQIPGSWAPPGDVRLPVMATAFNTLVLLTSGAMLLLAVRAFGRAASQARVRMLFGQAILLGFFFVAFQGFEWVKLIGYGMTMTSGIFGATFFLLIGSHGIHAAAAVLAMAFLFWRLLQDRLKVDQLRAMAIFWMFVVGVWPLLYGLVYFG